MSTSWKTENWYVSPYNFSGEVRSSDAFKQVEIHDTTLREGELLAGVVYGSEEKLKIAYALRELGIRHMEVALLTSGGHGPEALKAVANSGLDIRIFTMCRLDKKEIDLALKCDVSNLYLTLNAGVRFEASKQSLESVSDGIVDNITYAKEHGCYVNFFPTDSTRTDWALLSGLMKVAVGQGHADSVTVVDTYGVSLPEAFAYLVKKVKEIVSVPVEVHCHNTFGLGTSNALAGYRAGAEVLHACVDGIGMRNGDPPTEEVVMCLRALYNVDLGFKYEKLYKVCKLVEKLSKTKLARYKPIAGDGTFAFEALERIRSLMQTGELPHPYRPEFVGQRLQVVLSKNSDLGSIEAKVKELNISATRSEMEFMLKKVKEVALDKKRAVTDVELREIAQLSKRRVGLS